MLIFTKEFGNQKVFRSSIKGKGYRISPHMHQHIEIVVMLEGELDITVEGTRSTLNCGEVCVIAPLIVHSMNMKGEGKFFMTVFSGSCIPDWQIEGDSLSGRIDPIFKPTPEVFSYITSLLPINTDTQQVFFDDIPKNIRSALYAITAAYSDAVPLTPQPESRGALYSTVLYIGEHFRENITLASVGKALGYNPKYLSQCFSRFPDISFTSLLNSCRIELAKTMLIGTDLKIIDIAYECGYSEERTFRRVFTQTVGYSPSEYRKRRKKAT